MKNIGKLGERLVASWLETQGYQLLARNWTCRQGEIDLIAIHPAKQNLIFVEVKTRNRHNWDENGLLAIDEGKQEKICQAATIFLAKNPQLVELPCSFDVALVRYDLTRKLKNQVKCLTAKQFSVDGDFYQFNLQTYLTAAFDLA